VGGTLSRSSASQQIYIWSVSNNIYFHFPFHYLTEILWIPNYCVQY